MTKPLFAAILTASLLAGCSAEADDSSAEAAAPETAVDDTQDAVANEDAAAPEQAAAEADWTGINDNAVRTAIESKLAAKDMGLVVVERHKSDDFWGDAGMAAMDLGKPAMVVSTGQKDIQFVGDEGLAYFQEDRARIAKETAEFFDRGEYEQGVEHALKQIDAVFAGG